MVYGYPVLLTSATLMMLVPANATYFFTFHMAQNYIRPVMKYKTLTSGSWSILDPSLLLMHLQCTLTTTGGGGTNLWGGGSLNFTTLLWGTTQLIFTFGATSKNLVFLGTVVLHAYR